MLYVHIELTRLVLLPRIAAILELFKHYDFILSVVICNFRCWLTGFGGTMDLIIIINK